VSFEPGPDSRYLSMTSARRIPGDKEILGLLRMGDEAQSPRGRETIMLVSSTRAQQTQIKTGTPPFYIHSCHGTAELRGTRVPEPE
jgi:hypothetical protein